MEGTEQLRYACGDLVGRRRRVSAGVKVVDLKFHHASAMGGDPLIISTDTRSCKVWHQNSGKTYTTLEPATGDINDICIWPGSGFMVRDPTLPSHHSPGEGWDDSHMS
jgi:hypothetical protein